MSEGAKSPGWQMSGMADVRGGKCPGGKSPVTVLVDMAVIYGPSIVLPIHIIITLRNWRGGRLDRAYAS